MPARPFSGRTRSALAAIMVLALLVGSGAAAAAAAAQEDEQTAPSATAAESGGGATTTEAAPTPPPPLAELRVTAGSPAAEGRYSYICSLRSASSPYSDSFCGCAVVAPRVVLTAAHCLDQDDPSLRLPRVEIGRYRRLDAVRPGLDPPLTEADDGIQRLRCERSVVHPGWSFATTRNDLALCYLGEPTSWAPVRLADESDGALALEAGAPLAVIGWGTERAGAPEQSQALQRAVVPLVDLGACNATFNGVLREGQLCAGSAAAFGQLVADACQGDSGGPLVLEGKGGGDGAEGGDTQVGIVSFGESCGVLPGVYTSVAAYRRWIGETALAMAAEAGLAPEDVAQILPAAMAPREEGEEGGDQQQQQQERAVGVAAPSVEAEAKAGARAVLAAAHGARQQQQQPAAAISVPAVSGAATASDLAGALLSMVLLPGGKDPCACVSATSLAGAGGCRPLLGPAASEWGCFVSGGQSCALATQAGVGLFARGCRPSPSELWGARAAAAGPEGAAASALRAAAVVEEADVGAGGACVTPSAAAAAGARLRRVGGGGRARAGRVVVDPSAATSTRAANLPRVMAAALRVGYAEAAAAAARQAADAEAADAAEAVGGSGGRR